MNNLMGMVFLAMLIVGMIWLVLRGGLFQERSETVRRWRQSYLTWRAWRWRMKRKIEKEEKKKRARK